MFSKKVFSADNAADRQLIRELVEYERYCRDYGEWDEMYGLFHEDAQVHISWYDGPARGFIDASRHMVGAKHKIFNTIVEVDENRAVAEIITSIQSSETIGGVNVSLNSNVRLLYRIVNDSDGWKIFSINCIYENDALIPEYGQPLRIDNPVAESYRKSYRNLSIVLANLGKTVNSGLPGDDRPETVKEMYANTCSWLHKK